MKWIKVLFSSAWRLWFLIVFLFFFIFFMPALFFFTAIKKNQIIVAYLCRYWSKLTLWFSFVFPLVTWEEKINTNKTYIFCPNHISTLDIPLIYAILPNPLQFIGKAELTKLPFFGYFFKNNSVIVNRENRKDAYSAFLKSSDRLKDGISMCIFPEGGIPHSNQLLRRFKNGPFRLAIEENIILVPITIFDNKRIFPTNYFKGGPGIARVKMHKAINPNDIDKKSIDNLNKLVYNTIFEELKSYE